MFCQHIWYLLWFWWEIRICKPANTSHISFESHWEIFVHGHYFLLCLLHGSKEKKKKNDFDNICFLFAIENSATDLENVQISIQKVLKGVKFICSFLFRYNFLPTENHSDILDYQEIHFFSFPLSCELIE